MRELSFQMIINDPADPLLKAFAMAYPRASAPRVCRAPGRINLIGEHTDYNGLPVLPVTLDREIRIAFAGGSDSLVQLRAGDPGFPFCQFNNAASIPPSPPGSWGNYCKAAIHGLNEYFRVTTFPGMDAYVSGNIPIAAGLSSSSALVVAAGLAYLAILGIRLDEDLSRLELAQVLAEAEHYVGTRGGGMDQAILLLGEEGAACKIDFFPLRAEKVPLLTDYSFIVCHSLVRAEKTGDMMHRYNEGPLTCRLICALVERQVQTDFDSTVEIARLADLWHGHLCLTHEEVQSLFDRSLPTERMTLKQIAQRLNITTEEIRRRWLGDLKEPERGFHLRSRARHQLTEYQRVEAARDALQAGDADELGQLMNRSHESCATDYYVSCPELEALVAIAREAGALGARLTGAGFGGCTVNLVHNGLLEQFGAEVERKYYHAFMSRRQQTVELPERMLIARTSAGAGYLAPS
ncbi:MAG: galactokinase [Candidatus Hydrogenedentes bacterium]|nr:galactokinase [Candidatus Hydrogenedentota bacterium]